MFTQRVAQQYPPGSLMTSNMLARNTLPYPPGLAFYTTKFGQATPLYPPGLHVDPDVVRRQITPRYTSDLPLMSNMAQQFEPQYPAGIPFYTNKFGRTPHLYPPGPHIDPKVVRQQITSPFAPESPLKSSTVQQFGPQYFPELPLESNITQQVEQIAPRHPNGWARFSYPSMPRPRSPRISQPEVLSTPYEEETQRQLASNIQLSVDYAQIQQSPQPSYSNNPSSRHQFGEDHKLTEANMYMLQNGVEKRCGLPPYYDPWGLPNTDIASFQEMPYNSRLDLSTGYAEENPECVRIITPEEALNFGNWTGTDREWSFNHWIKSWVVHQEAEGITSSDEEVWENADELVFPGHKYEPQFPFEDTEDGVQPWDSGSWTKEYAENYMKNHEKFKEELEKENKAYSEDEGEWLPGPPHPEEARTLKKAMAKVMAKASRLSRFSSCKKNGKYGMDIKVCRRRKRKEIG
jgi:hypothetical protein